MTNLSASSGKSEAPPPPLGEVVLGLLLQPDSTIKLLLPRPLPPYLFLLSSLEVLAIVTASALPTFHSPYPPTNLQLAAWAVVTVPITILTFVALTTFALRLLTHQPRVLDVFSCVIYGLVAPAFGALAVLAYDIVSWGDVSLDSILAGTPLVRAIVLLALLSAIQGTMVFLLAVRAVTGVQLTTSILLTLFLSPFFLASLLTGVWATRIVKHDAFVPVKLLAPSKEPPPALLAVPQGPS